MVGSNSTPAITSIAPKGKATSHYVMEVKWSDCLSYTTEILKGSFSVNRGDLYETDISLIFNLGVLKLVCK